ncbi:MAG: type II secretion system protein GspN [Desulfobacula sp.]|nr:type II secretion system protein GspN [Desulfobacula sp.]
MSKTKQRSLYTAYIVLVIIFFLYYLFPSEAAKNFIITNVNHINPDVDITLKGVDPVFPIGLKLHNVSIYHEDDPVFDADKLTLSPGLLSLFIGRLSLKFDCDAYGGNFKGGAGMPVIGGGIDNMSADVSLTDIQVGDILAFKLFLPQYNFSGILTGDITYNLKKNRKRSLESQLNLMDSSVEFLASFYGLEALAFKQIDAEITLNNDLLKIEKLVSNGGDLSGNITGSINIKTPIQRSVLDLKADVTPGPVIMDKLQKLGPMVKMLLKGRAGKKGVPVHLTGTIEKPGFKPGFF